MIKLKLPIIKSFQDGDGLIYKSASNKNGDEEIEELSMVSSYFYYFQGKNGIGKTTLLNIISFLTDFDNGAYIDDGNIIIGENSDNSINKNNLRKEYFSYIFQDPHIINIYTIKENIKILNPEIDIENDLNMIKEKINDLEVPEREKKYISTKLSKIIKERNNSPFYLSGGEKQLLSFVRAMIKPSNIIFADEPWASMDIMLKEFVEDQLYKYLNNEDIFKSIREKHKTDHLEMKNTVIGIAHKFHHKNIADEYIKKDTTWEYKIPVNKIEDDNSVNHLNITRYKMVK